MNESVKELEPDDDYYESAHMNILEWKMSTSSNASMITSIEKAKRGKLKKPLNIVFKETAEA